MHPEKCTVLARRVQQVVQSAGHACHFRRQDLGSLGIGFFFFFVIVVTKEWHSPIIELQCLYSILTPGMSFLFVCREMSQFIHSYQVMRMYTLFFNEYLL